MVIGQEIMQKRRGVRLGAVLFAMVPLAAFPLRAEVPLDMHVGGRVVKEQASGALVYQWPATYFEARFAGPRLKLKIGRSKSAYRLILDGRIHSEIRAPTGEWLTYDGLGAGEHRVRLEKMSETQRVPETFYGFRVPRRSNARPAPTYKRRMEFIGDSFTVGYGNVSVKARCNDEEVFETTNSSAAFPILVAKRFGADYRVHAFSGKGMVRNYRGLGRTPTLPQMYDSPLFDGRTVPDSSGWRPGVVVVTLGINDFSTPLSPEARWSSREELRLDYRRTYAEFVGMIHGRYPQATIVLVAPNSLDDELATQLEAVRSGLSAKIPPAQLRFVRISSKNEGCNGHPSAAEHSRISEVLVNSLERDPVPAWRSRPVRRLESTIEPAGGEGAR